MIKNLIYDASRLITRTLNAAPNGIDRIDLLLANFFLNRKDTHALRFGLRGPVIFRSEDFPNPVIKAEMAWREKVPQPDDLYFLQNLSKRLLENPDGLISVWPCINLTQLRRRLLNPLDSFFSYSFLCGDAPVRAAPIGATYINATHFPIEWRSHVAWLDERQDIRVIMFVHDLLPIKRPEFFWTREPRRHLSRLEFLARRGSAALVTSRYVEEALSVHMKQSGRSDIKILCAPPPVASEFLCRPIPDDRLAKANYFVICGTVEPRKNHLLLVDVWRRLKGIYGHKTPKLIVVGKRGWMSDKIFNELLSNDLQSSIIFIKGIPTSIYKSILANAAALLAPSLAEGCDLPIGEALALGVPVIASNIEVHREYPIGSILLLETNNSERWTEAIIEAARTRSQGCMIRDPIQLNSETDYLRKLEYFLKNLS